MVLRCRFELRITAMNSVPAAVPITSCKLRWALLLSTMTKGSAGPGAVPAMLGAEKVSPSGATICAARQRCPDAMAGTDQAWAEVILVMSPGAKVTFSLPIGAKPEPKPKSPSRKFTVTLAGGAVVAAAARRDMRARTKFDPARLGGSPAKEPSGPGEPKALVDWFHTSLVAQKTGLVEGCAPLSKLG